MILNGRFVAVCDGANSRGPAKRFLPEIVFDIERDFPYRKPKKSCRRRPRSAIGRVFSALQIENHGFGTFRNQMLME